MVAKIIIKRRFKEDSTMEVLNLLNDRRAAAMSQPEYIFRNRLFYVIMLTIKIQ
ncbi:MAG: hypothetical protein SWH68_07445 [Thermodesulfobacteriota bacterium]|nr:hypothetical protein [Thermodesulfobacteriota bacterium]